MKIAFEGVINRLDMAKEWITEFEKMSVETSKMKDKEKKYNQKDRTEYPIIVGQLQKV